MKEKDIKKELSSKNIDKYTTLIYNNKKINIEFTSNNNNNTWTIINKLSISKLEILENYASHNDLYEYDENDVDDIYATLINVIDAVEYSLKKYNKLNKAEITEEITTEHIENHVNIISGYNLGYHEEAKEIFESISKGLLSAYSKKIKEQDIHYTCKKCGHNIPKYSGKYGKNCPNCGDNISMMKEFDKLDAVNVAFTRGETIKLKCENSYILGKIQAYTEDTQLFDIEILEGENKGKVLRNIKYSNISK